MPTQQQQQQPPSTSNGEQPSEAPALTLVEPHDDPNANILLYGPPKTGKTVAGSSAPGPLLYLNAERPNATRTAHRLHDFDEVIVEGLGTLIAAMDVVRKGKYRTVVLDPIGEAYRVILEGLSGRALSPAIQMYGDTGVHLERFCRALMDEPINTVLIAHEHGVKDEASGTVERMPWTGTNNPALAEKLLAMVDVIGYTGVVEGEGDKPDRYMAQLVNANGRRGGDRFGVLGKAADLDLTAWINKARNAGDNK